MYNQLVAGVQTLFATAKSHSCTEIWDMAGIVRRSSHLALAGKHIHAKERLAARELWRHGASQNEAILEHEDSSFYPLEMVTICNNSQITT